MLFLLCHDYPERDPADNASSAREERIARQTIPTASPSALPRPSPDSSPDRSLNPKLQAARCSHSFRLSNVLLDGYKIAPAGAHKA